MSISIMSGTQSYTNLYSAAATSGKEKPEKPKIDTDESGSISKDELTTFLSKAPSDDSTESVDTEEIFSSLDTDGNGEISSEEEKSLKDYLPKPKEMPSMSQSEGAQGAPQGAPPQGPPPSAMSMADTNSDSSINEDELSSLLSDVSEKTGTEVDSKEVFAALDTNEDGTISEEEAEGLKEYLPEPPKMDAQMQAQLQSAYSSGLDLTSSVGSTVNYAS